MAEVDTDSLINQAIEARAGREGQRRNLALQRRSIIDQLGATRSRDKGRIHALRAQLSGLDIGERELLSRDRNDQQLLGTQVSSAFRNANMAHKLSTDALNLQTAQQAGEVFNGFADLMSRTKPGTQAFRDGMTALKDKYPLGFAAEAVKGHLGQIAQFHDKEAEQNQKMLATKLFKDHSISPAQFATYTNDRATNAPILVNAKGKEDLKNGTPPTHDMIEQKRSNDGSTVAADIGGRTFLFKRDLFDNLKSTFGPNRPTDTSSTERPLTPEEYAVSQGYRDLNQYNQFLQTGKVVAPEGTVSASAVQAREAATQNLVDTGRVVGGTLEQTATARELGTKRMAFLEQNPQAIPAGTSGTALAQGRALPINFPANLQPNIPENRTSTLPAGVPPNQPLQPVVQLGNQPMGNEPQITAQPTATPAPQVAQQPTATPHPMEGQTVRNKTSGQMGTIINGIFVPDQQ